MKRHPLTDWQWDNTLVTVLPSGLGGGGRPKRRQKLVGCHGERHGFAGSDRQLNLDGLGAGAELNQ